MTHGEQLTPEEDEAVGDFLEWQDSQDGLENGYSTD